jgi:chaperonin cofactor prefoldin
MQDSNIFTYNTKKEVIKKITKKLSLPNGEQKRILQLEREVENLQSEVERLKAIISQRAAYYKNVA